jgi:hypothetical protein
MIILMTVNLLLIASNEVSCAISLLALCAVHLVTSVIALSFINTINP